MATKRTIKQFLKDVVLSNNPVSAKRFTTLAALGHYMAATIIIVPLLVIPVFYVTSAQTEVLHIIADLFKDLVEKSFYIILAGLGLITSTDMAAILKNKNFRHKRFDHMYNSSYFGNDYYRENDDTDTDELNADEIRIPIAPDDK